MRGIASQPVARFLFAVLGVVMVVVAFVWGDYVLGLAYGFAYAMVAVMLLWLAARARTPAGQWSRVQLGILLVLAVPVGYAMAFPAWLNPSLQHFIDKQATDRAASSELAAVFASDPAYGDLSASTKRSKLVSVTIRGSLETRAGFDRLRSQIASECPALERCFLDWDVTLRDSAQQINRLDWGDPFPAADKPL